MATMQPQAAPTLPFPIFQISQKIERYILYDINVITWLRRTHNILGVLIGTLPQIPQQNVFLGLPLELQPEEARLLVDRGLAYVVNDLDRHKSELAAREAAQWDDLRTRLQIEGRDIAKDMERRKKRQHETALKRIQKRKDSDKREAGESSPVPGSADEPSDESLFGEALTREHTVTPSSPANRTADSDLQPYSVTPTSHGPLFDYQSGGTTIIPKVDPPSYALFAHLHRLGYFMIPGLRFGCQFSVYPGDPLRFHSHFLAISAGWDEELDLLHMISGGRLGTRVKKGWLIGGAEEDDFASDKDPTSKGAVSERKPGPDTASAAKVRTFCIEWGGM